LLEWRHARKFDYEVISASLPELRCGVRTGSTKKTLLVFKRAKSDQLKRIKICKVGAKTLTDVASDNQRIIKDMLDGNHFGEKQPDKITLADALNDYIADTTLSEGTVRNYKTSANGYFKDWLNKPTISITPEMCKQRFMLITNKGTSEDTGTGKG
jgi:hypothetical protein